MNQFKPSRDLARELGKSSQTTTQVRLDIGVSVSSSLIILPSRSYDLWYGYMWMCHTIKFCIIALSHGYKLELHI
jgi:hypothetical protein